MDDLPVKDRPAGDGLAGRRHGEHRVEPRDRCQISTGRGAGIDQLTVEFEQTHTRAVAQIPRAADDQVEHGLGGIGRVRHCLQDINGRGLLFDLLAVLAIACGEFGGAFLQCAIRLGAADGNDRLLSEVLQQFHLRDRKFSWRSAAQSERANRSARAHQRHARVRFDPKQLSSLP